MPPAGRTAAPCLPRSASCHASSIQLDVTGACFIHTLSEPRSLRSAIHAARASAAIALCFFAFHAPEATRAAYSSEYRIHMGPVVLRRAHWRARVKATSEHRFVVVFSKEGSLFTPQWP